MKSVFSVLIGLVLALILSSLLVIGIFAPILSVVFGLEEVNPSSALPALLLLFACGFSFYFGGMATGYYAPRRRVLHGLLVGILACAISPLVNLAAGRGPLPETDSAWTLALLVGFVAVAIASSFVGGRRGAALYAYNRQFVRKAEGRRSRRPDS